MPKARAMSATRTSPEISPRRVWPLPGFSWWPVMAVMRLSNTMTVMGILL